MLSLITEWYYYILHSGNYMSLSKVYVDPSDIYRDRILSFHSPDTSERNIHILNDLMWAFRWLNGGMEIILHYPKYILIHWTCEGIEYCLSIHQIHQKEIFTYWITWCEHLGGSMGVWGLYYIVQSGYWSTRHVQE